ncbi:MAG: AAA family ATPase [Cyanobacteria bacterium]|nr:AAA family ATPase [Cyanobacteriota bacterium]
MTIQFNPLGVARNIQEKTLKAGKAIETPLFQGQSPVLSPLAKQDSFQRVFAPKTTVHFGANTGVGDFPQYPLETLTEAEILEGLPSFPFQIPIQALAQKTGADPVKVSVENFFKYALNPVLPIAQDIEKIQENPGGLDPQAEGMMEIFEQLLPDSARGESFKSKEIHRLIYTHIMDQWGKETEPESQGIPRKRNNIMDAIMGGGRSVGVKYDPALAQLLTLFIKSKASKLDRTMGNLIELLLEVKDKPGVPPEIKKMGAQVLALRKEIEDGIKLGTLTVPQEADSAPAFRKKLKMLYDETKPAPQRLMSEKQYVATKRLIDTMERSGKGDPSSNIILNRLHTILHELPWTKTETNHYSLEDVKKALDDDHFGLEEVKSHIIDHMGKELHVSKLRKLGKLKKSDEKPTIICLVGPPGVGKTSLGKSIAKATGRNFVRVGLGGVSDEAAIRGHRSTYIGAMAGRLVTGLIEAKSKNPVMLLDEIDKLGRDFKGDPAAALLEALDPEQNSTFTDHYLGIETDLSDTLFITTANSLDTIPPALLDRMHVIQLKGYTTDEKLEIAKRHLIPKARRANGLAKEMLDLPKEVFNVPDDALKAIIQNYAPERGVRQLENNILTIAKKQTSKISGISRTLKPSDFPTITPENLKDYLGAEKHDVTPVDPTPQVGIANGMYYSEGARPGGTLGVGVTLVERKVSDVEKQGLSLGRITGQMKDTMKESAERAFSFVEANMQRLGIDLAGKQIKVDIHTGDQTPKDGPSAGGVLTLALISALTGKKIPGDFAMTGAFNPLGEGKLLKIGGVREKVTGAVEEGVKRIVIPKANETDVVDIPASIRARVEIKPASTMQEVMDYVFGESKLAAAPPAPVTFSGNLKLVKAS